MKIKLSYGNGFSGTTYYLSIKGNDEKVTHYTLLSGNGSEEEEFKAKSKAKDILNSLKIEFDLDKIDFEWDGTM